MSIKSKIKKKLITAGYIKLEYEKKKYNNLVEEFDNKIGKKLIENSNAIYEISETIKRQKVRKNKFTIVTCALNTEEYIDDYFFSLISQSHDFVKYLHVIFIDDGSIDNTGGIVKKWREKYPENITYIYQKNTGQSQARNIGLQHVNTKWVNFLDSDDKLGIYYFEKINEAIELNKDTNIFAGRVIFWKEGIEELDYSHPLDYKFHENINKVSLLEKPKCFQLSQASAVFNMDVVRSYNLKIRDIKPHFEDGYFICEYIFKTKNYNICYLKDAEYIYRKRVSGTSTLDTASNSKIRFIDHLDNYLNLIKMYENVNKKIPEFIQTLILYELKWNIMQFEDSKLDFTDEEVDCRHNKMYELFKYIDYDIMIKNWEYFWALFQIGFNKLFYKSRGFYKSALYYYNSDMNTFSVVFYGFDNNYTIQLDDKIYQIEDFDKTVVKKTLNNKYIADEIMVRLPLKFLNAKFYDHDTCLKLRGVPEKIKFKKLSKNSICLFFDRIFKADDNAEYLYKWWVKHHSNYCNMYFVISAQCDDFYRLKNEGVNVVDYDSENFLEIYEKADFIFSSSFDKEIENLESARYPKYKCQAKFIALQHGVCINDLSKWWEGKRINKVICSTLFERDNFVKKYNLSKEQIIVSGLPRYDNLLKKVKTKKNILFLPTWRQKLSGISEEEFMKTEYYHEISSIIQKFKTEKSLLEYTLKVILHPQICEFSSVFVKLNSINVEILNANIISYQQEINSCVAAITDYSSVIFDVSLLEKPTYYYQFDKKVFFKYHISNPEIDYVTQAPGIYVKSISELIDKLKIDSLSNFSLSEELKNECKQFFDFEYGKSCENIYNRLLKDYS